MMRWAVVGSAGMFGSEMVEYLAERNQEVTAFGRDELPLDGSARELSQALTNFEVIVNAVGYTAVDLAEADVSRADEVNGVFAGKLAQVAKGVGARFIHISTDYVFDGTGTQPHKVTDSTNPTTAYGKSKLLGEKLVAESGADFSILRTAWLYSSGGKNFAKTIAAALLANGQVRVVGDQIGQPTWVRDLAGVVYQVAQLEAMPRIVHAVSSGRGSWADFAREISKSLGLSAESVVEVTSAEFATVVKRPAFSVLDNSSYFIEPIGDWRERWKVAAPAVLREFL